MPDRQPTKRTPKSKDPPAMNLHQRLLRVMAGGAVGKDGRAMLGGGSPKPVHTIDGVVDHLRPLLVENGILALPTVAETKSEHLEARDGKMLHVFDARVSVQFINVDDPADQLTVPPFPGQGFDYSDKASGKAVSYALKTLYLAFFCLRGQPDPEQDHHEPPKPARRAANDGRVSEPQIRKLFASAKEAGIASEDAREAAKARYKLDSLKDLTGPQLQDFLAILAADRITEEQAKKLEELTGSFLDLDMDDAADWLQMAERKLLTETEAEEIIAKGLAAIQDRDGGAS